MLRSFSPSMRAAKKGTTRSRAGVTAGVGDRGPLNARIDGSDKMNKIYFDTYLRYTQPRADSALGLVYVATSLPPVRTTR